MKRIRIIKEEKYFKISSEGYYSPGHGFSFTIEGKVYYEEPFISEDDCKAKMDLANKEWEEMDLTPEKPKLEIYWKIIEEKIEQTEVES